MVSQGCNVFHDWLWLPFSVGLHARGQTCGWTRPCSLDHLNYTATLLVTASVAQGVLRGLNPPTTIVGSEAPSSTF